MVTTDAKPNVDDDQKEDWGQTFKITDGNIKNAVSSAKADFPVGFAVKDDFTADSGDIFESDYSWVQSKAKSSKECAVTDDSPADASFAYVTCTNLNAHWFRNMETVQKDQDVQISIKGDAAQTYKAFGW